MSPASTSPLGPGAAPVAIHPPAPHVGVDKTVPPAAHYLLASAQRLSAADTARKKSRGPASASASWQADAWAMYEQVGEERFLATTLAGRLSQAKLYVGRLDRTDPTAAPEPVDAAEAADLADILDAIGGGPTGRAQLIRRLGVNLFVAGEGWIAALPREVVPEDLRDRALSGVTDVAKTTGIGLGALVEGLVDIRDLEWFMLSVSELAATQEKTVKVKLGPAPDEQFEVDPDGALIFRVWWPHPERSWEADSPTRSSLPVLRELVGLTMHISAQVDSRLAGAGILAVPESATRALRARLGLPGDSEEDPFTDSLIEAMLTPIGDRAAASALVPLVVTVPDDVVDKIKHVTFSAPLDDKAKSLRDEAIRRLALGQDAPPELLMGVGGMNHWGAWLVREDVVTTHLEPPLALICDALTKAYLRPVLAAQGYSPDEIDDLVIWYDISHMIVRPTRSQDALDLYNAGVLSAEALREAMGFEESDAPDDPALDFAQERALQMATQNTMLLSDPGLPALVEQIRAVVEDRPVNPAIAPPPADDAPPPPVAEPDEPADDGPTEGAPPTTDGDAPVAPAAAASAVGLETLDYVDAETGLELSNEQSLAIIREMAGRPARTAIERMALRQQLSLASKMVDAIAAQLTPAPAPEEPSVHA